MLKNAYLVAKIGADTAENERNFAENLPKIGNYPTGPSAPRDIAWAAWGLGQLDLHSAYARRREAEMPGPYR